MKIPLASLAVAVPVLVLGGCASQEAVDAATSSCSVEGCVRKPGAVALAGGRTVFDAVLAAEPIEGRSDLQHVQVVRQADPPLVMTIDLTRMVETGDSTFNVQLQAGDVITVPELP